MSFSTTSFHLLGLPFFESLTANFFAFTGFLSLSILSTYPIHLNFCCLTALSRTFLSSPRLSYHEFSDCLCNLLMFFHTSCVSFSFQWMATSFHLLFSKPIARHHSIRHFSHNFIYVSSQFK